MTKTNLSDMIELLSGVEPIASLNPGTVRKLAENCVVEKLEAGTVVFNAGEKDEQSVYLVSGALLLTPAGSDSKDARTLQADTQEAKYPVDDEQPHCVSAVAGSPSEIIRIDIELLDKLIAEDQLSACRTALTDKAAGEVKESGWRDFFSRMIGRLTGGKRAAGEEVDAFALVCKFRPPLFKTISEENLKEICARMETVTARSGSIVIRQGDEGNYYYMIVNGAAKVTRKAEEHSEPILLAELGEGETFGEEALLSNAKRNATVSMKTRGMLLRLAKHDFVELLKEPMLKWLSPLEARDAIKRGGKWLDVRPSPCFKRSHLGGAISVPLHELRARIGELDQAVPYVCCCDTGRLSCSAAFLLGQRGYNAAVLRGGLQRFTEG